MTGRGRMGAMAPRLRPELLWYPVSGDVTRTVRVEALGVSLDVRGFIRVRVEPLDRGDGVPVPPAIGVPSWKLRLTGATFRGVIAFLSTLPGWKPDYEGVMMAGMEEAVARKAVKGDGAVGIRRS